MGFHPTMLLVIAISSMIWLLRQHGFDSMLKLAQIAPLDQSVVLDVGSNTSSPLKNAHKLKSLMLILLWRFGCVVISDQQIFF